MVLWGYGQLTVEKLILVRIDRWIGYRFPFPLDTRVPDTSSHTALKWPDFIACCRRVSVKSAREDHKPIPLWDFVESLTYYLRDLFFLAYFRVIQDYKVDYFRGMTFATVRYVWKGLKCSERRNTATSLYQNSPTVLLNFSQRREYLYCQKNALRAISKYPVLTTGYLDAQPPGNVT